MRDKQETIRIEEMQWHVAHSPTRISEPALAVFNASYATSRQIARLLSSSNAREYNTLRCLGRPRW